MTTSMIFYIIQTNYVDLSIVIFLYIFLLTNRSMPKEVNRKFLLYAISINILIVVDSIDFYLEQATTPNALRYMTSATGYVLRSAPILVLALILKRQDKIKIKLLALPIFINAVIAYTSIFTKWMFYFDENNKFFRGPLGSIPFIVCGFYMALILYWSLNKYRLGHKKEGSITVFMVMSGAFSSFMESVFHYKFLINGVAGISCVFYYLFLHTQTYARDALTQTLNRHMFYMDCEEYQKIQTVIVSVDLNDLKVINDTQGHAKGDLAIVTVANALHNMFSRRGKVYRTGGDEFIILCPKVKEEDVVSKMKLVEEELKKTSYQIAWGVATSDPGMNFERALSESDAKMYKDKKEKKRGHL